MVTMAVPVDRSCPACTIGIVARGILAFRRVYLCDSHRATWDTENAKDLARAERGRSATGRE